MQVTVMLCKLGDLDFRGIKLNGFDHIQADCCIGLSTAWPWLNALVSASWWAATLGREICCWLMSATITEIHC